MVVAVAPMAETDVPLHAPRVDGRTRLLDTAELLLDKHGIDGVSLRTVTSASGHRNASAVNYHFGNRDQLVMAVLTRRQGRVEARRMELIDELEARGTISGRQSVELAVVPLGELLDDETGRRYIRLLNQAANHPIFASMTADAYSGTLARLVPYVLPLVAHLPTDRAALRLRMGVSTALVALADQARLIDAAEPSRAVLDRTTFVSDLIDAVEGALRA